MKKLNFVIAASLVLIFLGSISAAGIASPYWKDYPLLMNYGETKIVNFNLQNMVGDKDITVEVTLKSGGDIATLEKTTYTAEAHTSDTLIPLTITIPKDYPRDFQKIELEVKTVSPDQEGMVSLGTGWTTSFNVILSNDEKSSNLTGVVIFLIILIVILGVIIFALVNKRKRAAPKKRTRRPRAKRK